MSNIPRVKRVTRDYRALAGADDSDEHEPTERPAKRARPTRGDEDYSSEPVATRRSVDAGRSSTASRPVPPARPQRQIPPRPAIDVLATVQRLLQGREDLVAQLHSAMTPQNVGGALPVRATLHILRHRRREVRDIVFFPHRWFGFGRGTTRTPTDITQVTVPGRVHCECGQVAWRKFRAAHFFEIAVDRDRHLYPTIQDAPTVTCKCHHPANVRLVEDLENEVDA